MFCLSSRGLAVHLVADDGSGRAAHGRADDGALGGGAGDLADNAADDRAARGAEDETALGVTGAGRRPAGGQGEEQDRATGAVHRYTSARVWVHD